MSTVATSAEGWRSLREGILGWARANPHYFPWRTELPAWQALVTEMLLQRTRAANVQQIYDSFFTTFPNVEALAAATEEEIGREMFSLGLRWRAKYIHELANTLTEREVPDTFESLCELPGVGPYVSAAYLALHRNQSAAFVDANVVRLLARYWSFDFDGETRRKRWFLNLVDELFNHEHEPRQFGYALLDFTREVCGASPDCGTCPVRDECAFGVGATVTSTPIV